MSELAEFESAWRLARQSDVVAGRVNDFERLRAAAGIGSTSDAVNELQFAAHDANELFAEHWAAVAAGTAAAADTDGEYQQLLEASTVIAAELERAHTHLAAARDGVLRGMVTDEAAEDFLTQVGDVLAEVDALTH